MDRKADVSAGVMRIVNHHLYELSRGIRPLSMLTMTAEVSDAVVARLAGKGVCFYVHEACPTKVNVLFGKPVAVAAARRFLSGPLCKLSPEHDFMLGILLGYDREQQCVRYIERQAAVNAPEASLPPPSEIDDLPNWLDAAVEANPERAN